MARAPEGRGVGGGIGARGSGGAAEGTGGAMTTRAAVRRRPAPRPARRSPAVLLAGLGLAGLLAGCSGNQSGDSFPDRQSDTVPLPGEPSASPS